MYVADFKRSLVCFSVFCSWVVNYITAPTLEITSGAGEETVVKEGEAVDILCSPGEVSTLIVWFRMLDTSGMDFIATFTKHGMTKATATHYSSKFNDAKIQQNILTLKSFNKARDIGTYCCATLYKGVELRFGKVTRLVGGEFSFLNLV